ncbi:MAG TPA: DUF2520 domain-containing protein [Saprospiraceae bacterium]|nr:DUF2520 domain-containing protein [Saprospiraceae bacterium]
MSSHKKNIQVAFIGSGNVAWHLCLRLKDHISIEWIYGRNKKSATELAVRMSVRQINDLITASAPHILIIAVQDQQIEKVVHDLKELFWVTPELLVLHTSGSVAGKVFADHGIENYGVLYPLQTFIKGEGVSWDEIPVFITCSNNRNLEMIQILAESLSDTVICINDEEREVIHLAAVISNNFTHHLLVTAMEFLKENQLNPGWLHPLIKLTIQRALDDQATELQTGPARRGDYKTIQSHETMLAAQPALLRLYRNLSKSIINMYKHENRS